MMQVILNLTFSLEVFFHSRHTMSGISLDTNKGRRAYIKDFCVATPEEFVKSFGGDVVINKVRRLTVATSCWIFVEFLNVSLQAVVKVWLNLK